MILGPVAQAFLLPASSIQAPVKQRPTLATAAEHHGGGSPHEVVPRSTLGAGLSVVEALDMLTGLDDPTVGDYNVALAACAREGHHEPGCWLIEEMSEWGLEPDRTSYALAIESCAPAGMVEEARHLLSCMKDAGALRCVALRFFL